MCFKRKDKWTGFKPTDEYLLAVKSITSVTKLYIFIQRLIRKEDITDYWQTPEETLRLLTYDCDDTMRFTIDVLVRIIGIKEARGLVYTGYNKAKWGNKIKGHAVTIFPYQGKLAVFSNKEFLKGINSYEEAGHITFPDGLKYMEIRDWQGKILSKKSKSIWDILRKRR